MPYFRDRAYISDSLGGSSWNYAQRISSEIAEAVDNSGTPGPAFGWTNAVSTATTKRPTAVTMRTIDLVSSDGTRRRRVPIGDVANASLWSDPANTVDLQDALGNTVTYSVVGRQGERRRFPQTGAF